MNIVPHDPEREPRPERPADGPPLVFTPFRTIVFRRGQEMRIDLSEKGDTRAVSVRLWKSGGRDRPLQPEHPWHLLPAQLPAVIAALTAAAAAIGVEIPPAPAQAIHLDTSGGALPPSTTSRERNATSPERSHS